MTYFPVWMAQLQPASWNGVPFVVNTSTFTYGRRVAIHEYPFKDHPYVEDLGRDRQQVAFRGFLVGDDVFDQRDAMVQACNRSGAGSLVHPSLGAQRAYLISASFSETKERGRTVEIDFTFIISDDLAARLYPVSNIASQFATDSFASTLDEASSADFFTQVGTALQQGEAAVNGAISTVASFTSMVLAPIRDAARLVNMVSGMSGLLDVNHSYGRFNSGNLSFAPSVLGTISTGLSVVGRTEAGVNALVNDAVVLRSGVEAAASNVAALAEAL